MRVTLDEVCTKATSKYAQKDLANMTGEYPVFGASGFIKNIGMYQQEKTYVAVVKDGAGIGRTMLLPGKSSVIGTMQYLLPKENIIPKFLYYAVKSMHLEKYYTGATIPHIYFKDYKKETFDLPKDIRQKEIINILDKVELIIQSRKLQLKALDELIKSRFVEMFGSVKTNSMNWPIVEIGNIIEKLEAGWSGSGQQRDKKSGEIAVLKVSSVTQGYFIPEECKVLDNQKNIKKYIFPQKGDLLFSRANTREMVGATAIIMMDYPELILPDKLWKIQFKDNANVFYMKQVLSSTCIRKRFSAVSTGTSGSMYNVSMDKYKKIDIPLPPVNLQEKFAEFIIDIHKSRLLFKCQLLQYHNIEHIIRGRNYG